MASHYRIKRTAWVILLLMLAFLLVLVFPHAPPTGSTVQASLPASPLTSTSSEVEAPVPHPLATPTPASVRTTAESTPDSERTPAPDLKLALAPDFDLERAPAAKTISKEILVIDTDNNAGDTQSESPPLIPPPL